MTKQEIEMFEKLLTSAAWNESITKEERQAIWTAIKIGRRLHNSPAKFNIGDVVQWDNIECTVIGVWYDVEKLYNHRELLVKYSITGNQPYDKTGYRKFYETADESELTLVTDVDSKVFMLWR